MTLTPPASIMPEKRTILFLSSDPRTVGRTRWEKEYSEVKEALKRADHGKEFELKEQFAVRRRDIRRSLLEHKPAILHISGKDDGEGILVEAPNGDVSPIPPAALADLLGKFSANLQWVILSGCFQPVQASAISEEIPYVLGLSHDLSPETRTEAAVSIYDAMGAGEQDPHRLAGFARSAILMANGQKNQVHLYHKGKEVEIGKGKVQPVQATTTLPDLDDIISRFEAFQCDRTEQSRLFQNQLEGSTKGQFRFFVIHGEDPQSHYGLFSRFYHRYLCEEDEPELTPMYKVPLPQMESLEAYQGVIRERLLTAMKMGRILLKPDELEMTEAGRKLARREVENVAVEFRVRSSHWKDFTPQLIEWFVNDYCQYQGDSAFYPVFYFFVSIIYEHNVDHEYAATEIRRLLPDLQAHCHVLDELMPVSKADILAWIEEYMTRNAIRRQNLWNRYFPENRDLYDMVEVELRLNTLINREPPDI